MYVDRAIFRQKIIVSLLRPKTFMVIALQYFVAIELAVFIQNQSIGAVISGKISYILVGLFSLACWYINATSINDLADFEIDKINLKKELDRPLVNNQTNAGSLVIIAIASAILGSLMLLIISWQSSVLFLLLILLNYIYSMPPIRVSYRGLLAPALLPIGYVVLPFILGTIVVAGSYSASVVLVLLGLYMLFFSRVLLKDFRDVKGDKKFGKLTFLLRHSVKVVTATSAFACTIGVGLLSYFVIKYINMSWVVVAMLFILGVTLAFYDELSKTQKWDQQKMILPSIGRLITAQTILLVLTMLVKTETTNLLLSLVMIMSITIMFFVSAIKNYQAILNGNR